MIRPFWIAGESAIFLTLSRCSDEDRSIFHGCASGRLTPVMEIRKRAMLSNVVRPHFAGRTWKLTTIVLLDSETTKKSSNPPITQALRGLSQAWRSALPKANRGRPRLV